MAKGMPDDPARGERLRQLRDQRAQTTVASGAGVGVRSLAKWENGDSIIWAKLQALADYFGVSPQWIAYGQEREDSRAPGDRVAQIERRLDALEAQLAAVSEAVGVPRPEDGDLEEWLEDELAAGDDDQDEDDDEAAGGQQ